MRFEVAEDGNRFAFGQERLFPDGNPNYGTPFVTEGYIYPEGTLNGSNGVLPDGSAGIPRRSAGQMDVLRLHDRRSRAHHNWPMGRLHAGLLVQRQW